MNKGKGWHNDRYRHKLASHGIKTIHHEDISAIYPQQKWVDEEYDTTIIYPEDTYGMLFDLDGIKWAYNNLLTERQKENIDQILLSKIGRGDTSGEYGYTYKMDGDDENLIEIYNVDKKIQSSIVSTLLHEVGHDTFERFWREVQQDIEVDSDNEDAFNTALDMIALNGYSWESTKKSIGEERLTDDMVTFFKFLSNIMDEPPSEYSKGFLEDNHSFDVVANESFADAYKLYIWSGGDIKNREELNELVDEIVAKDNYGKALDIPDREEYWEVIYE